MKAVHSGLTSGVLSCLFLLRRMCGMVVGSAIFTALLRGGARRGKVPPCAGEKTGCARPEMCRAQFLRPCLFYPCLVRAL